jgi:hypothetical protein
MDRQIGPKYVDESADCGLSSRLARTHSAFCILHYTGTAAASEWNGAGHNIEGEQSEEDDRGS